MEKHLDFWQIKEWAEAYCLYLRRGYNAPAALAAENRLSSRDKWLIRTLGEAYYSQDETHAVDPQHVENFVYKVSTYALDGAIGGPY